MRQLEKLEAEAQRIHSLLEQDPLQNPRKPVRVPVPGGQRKVRVVPLARPEVDVHLLAKALLDYVESQQANEGEAA